MAPVKTKTLATAKNASEVAAAYQKSRGILVDQLKVPVGKLDDKDIAKIAAQLAAANKQADFVASYDGEWLTYEAKIGSQKSHISSVNVKALGKPEEVYEIEKGLAAAGLAAAPVDPALKTQWSKRVTELEQDLQRIKDIRASYQSFTYASDAPTIHHVFEEWANQQGKGHLIGFVDAVTAKLDAKATYEKYLKAGAKTPIKLSPQVAAAIAKDIAAKKSPDLAAAQKEVLGVINTKLIPQFKAAKKTEIDASEKRTKDELATTKKALQPVGAK